MTDISVVVGTYNRLASITTCVDSVIRETDRLSRLYVSDAGSTDGTVEYLESVASDRIVPIFEGERVGQARAYNNVLRTVSTPYVGWISDDNTIVNGGLDLAAQILDHDPRIGMVALKVTDMQGPFVAAPYIGGMSALGILNVNQGLLRTEVMAEAGYFSEEFRDYGIDPDLTAKVLLAGHHIVYTRPVAILHYRQWETDPATPAYGKMRKRQEQYQARYQAIYRPVLGRSLRWLLKKAAWNTTCRLLGPRYDIDSTRAVGGLIARDWHNIFSGRYISVLDPIRHRGKPYHLRQQARRGRRRAGRTPRVV